MSPSLAASSSLPDVGLVARTVARLCYDHILSIVVLNVLFVVFSIPVVTLGGSVLALLETLATIVDDPHHRTVRSRAALFVQNFRGSLIDGIPYTIVLLLTAFSVITYRLVSIQTSDAWYQIGVLVGFYAIVVVPIWLLRVAHLALVEAPASSGFYERLVRSGRQAMAYPGFTFLHLSTFAVLLVLSSAVSLLLWFLLPGILVIIEVVAYEELLGAGAGELTDHQRDFAMLE